MLKRLLVGLVLATGITDAATAGQRWLQRAQAEQQKFVDGVQNTPKDPAQLAVAQEASLLANVTQAITSGRWRRGVLKAGKAKWQAMTVVKAANYSSGIAAGQGNYEAAMSVWLPFMATVQSQIATMAKGTLAASQARSAAWQAALYNKKRTG